MHFLFEYSNRKIPTGYLNHRSNIQIIFMSLLHAHATLSTLFDTMGLVFWNAIDQGIQTLGRFKASFKNTYCLPLCNTVVYFCIHPVCSCYLSFVCFTFPVLFCFVTLLILNLHLYLCQYLKTFLHTSLWFLGSCLHTMFYLLHFLVVLFCLCYVYGTKC